MCIRDRLPGEHVDPPVYPQIAETAITSPFPTPGDVALADITTVDPVDDETVVPGGIAAGAVISTIVAPLVNDEGVEAKCSVLLPAAVVLLVVAELPLI